MTEEEIEMRTRFRSIAQISCAIVFVFAAIADTRCQPKFSGTTRKD